MRGTPLPWPQAQWTVSGPVVARDAGVLNTLTYRNKHKRQAVLESLRASNARPLITKSGREEDGGDDPARSPCTPSPTLLSMHSQTAPCRARFALCAVQAADGDEDDPDASELTLLLKLAKPLLAGKIVDEVPPDSRSHLSPPMARPGGVSA